MPKHSKLYLDQVFLSLRKEEEEKRDSILQVSSICRRMQHTHIFMLDNKVSVLQYFSLESRFNFKTECPLLGFVTGNKVACLVRTN